MKKLTRLAVLIFSLLLLSYSSNAYAVQNFTQKAKPVQFTEVAKSQLTAHQVFQKLPQPKPNDESYQKSQTVAFILAVTLGQFGMHRFYLGYNKIGTIMFILTLTGIGAFITSIWALIDAIHILTGKLKPADGSEYRDRL